MLTACVRLDWDQEVTRAAEMAGGGDEATALLADRGSVDQVRLPRLRRPSFSGPIVVVPGVLPQAEHAVPEGFAPV